eukprot:scaffold296195_cov35-Tisochrysis_lutea.AAC.3
MPLHENRVAGSQAWCRFRDATRVLHYSQAAVCLAFRLALRQAAVGLSQAGLGALSIVHGTRGPFSREYVKRGGPTTRDDSSRILELIGEASHPQARRRFRSTVAAEAAWGR